MALRTILIQDDPALKRKCRPVTVFDARMKQLAEDLEETLLASGGIGLAAPQVGVLRRAAVVLDITKEPNEVIVMFNPEIIEQKSTQRVPEGCLSFPDVWGYVTRPAWVKIRAQDVEGNWFEREADGAVAQCFSHEVDHLNGVVFLDKIEEYIDPKEIQQQ